MRKGWTAASLSLLLLLASLPARASGEATVAGILSAVDGDPDAAAARILDLGVSAVPDLVRSGERFRSPDQVETVIRALRRLSPRKLQPYLLAFVSGSGEDRGRLVAYRALADEGDADAILALIGVMDENHPHMKRPAEKALVKLLRRHDDPGLYLALEDALLKVKGETRARVLCRIGETNSGHGLRLLARQLGRDREMDPVILTAVTLLANAPGSGEVVPKLREVLKEGDPALRREAITALCQFGDADSAKSFIAGLSDGDAGVRGNSLWALRTMSGLRFPPEKSRWSLWLTDEMTWWKEEGQALLGTLENGTDPEIIAAIRKLSEHRLFRKRFQAALLSLREKGVFAVRAAADRALADLGLTTGRSLRDVGEALAARGFYPVEGKVARTRPVAPLAPPAEPSGSSWLVPWVGLFLILVLLLRLFGSALMAGLKRFWGERRPTEGPVTIDLHRDAGER